MLFVDAGADHVNIGTATDLSGVLNVDGNISLSGAGTGNRSIALLNETDSYEGTLIIQAGGVSSAYGGGIRLYGHSHASKPGDVVAGISSGSGGSFRVNTSGVDTGSDKLEVTETGSFIVTPGAGGHAVFNEGSVDADFRVESNNHDNMFFIDGGNDGIGIGNSTIIDWSTNYPGLQMGQAGALYGHKSSNQMSYAMNWGVVTGNNYIVDGAASRMLMGADGSISFDTSASGSAAGVITGINTLVMSSSAAVFNEGSADIDFRVESNAETHMLFVDGGNNRVGIMQSSPATSLHMGDGSGDQQIRMEVNGGGASIKGTDTDNNASSGYTVGHLTGTNGYQLLLGTIPIFDMYKTAVIFNEGSVDMDFRFESNSNANMLMVDGGGNRVGIGRVPSVEALEVAGNLKLEADNAEINLRSGVGGTTGAINWTFNTDATDFASIKLDYDTRASVGLHMDVGYPIRIDSSSSGGITFLASTVNTNVFSSTTNTFNEQGNDVDFRVESDTNAHALFIAGVGLAANNLSIGMGTGTITNPYSQTNFTDLNINGVWGGVISFKLGGTEKGWIGQRNSGNGGMAIASSSGNSLYLNSGGNVSRMEFTSAGDAVVNPTGTSADFTVSSDNKSDMFVVDGGADSVNVNGHSTNSHFNVGSDGYSTLDEGLISVTKALSIRNTRLSGSSNTANRTVTISISDNGLKASEVHIYASGNKYNSGTQNFAVKMVHVLMEESGTMRINSDQTSNLGYRLGNQESKIGSVTYSSTGGGNLTGTFTVQGEYDTLISVQSFGPGTNAINSVVVS